MVVNISSSTTRPRKENLGIDVSVDDRYTCVQLREFIYQFGPFQLSDGERVLRRDDRLMSLPPKAFTALSVLVKAEGKVVSKAVLLAAVWPDTFVEEGVLTQTISILRHRLSTRRAEESPIETISRVGYRLRLQVSRIERASGFDTIATIENSGGKTALGPPVPLGVELIQQENTGMNFAVLKEHYSVKFPRSTFVMVILVACLVAGAALATSFPHASQVIRRQVKDPQRASELPAVGLAFPRNEQAKRLYIEGVNKLRSWDSVAAAHALEASIALEPDFALSHTELAHAVTLLGQSDRALQEANRGRALAAQLSRIDQLRIRAMCEAAEHRFEAAAATYATLFALAPNDLEYARSQASLLENAGHNKEAIDLLEPLMKESTRGSVTAASELVIGQGYSNVGDHPTAQKWAERAEDDAKNQGDLMLYERALTAEAYALGGQHRPDAALQRAKRALELAIHLEDGVGTLQATLATAQTKTDMGMLNEAQVDLQRALSQAEATRQVQKQIFALDALGHNYSSMGNHENALFHFQRGAVLARSFGLPGSQHRAEFNAANEEWKLGHKSAARTLFSRLLDEAINSGDKTAAQRVKQALLGTAAN